MRKFVISAAVAVAALSTAAPAAAQYGYPDRGGWDQRDNDRNRGNWDRRGPGRNAVFQLQRRLQQVEQRIQLSARRGIVSPREANSLQREAYQIRNRLHRAGRNGLSGREFAQLNQRIVRLEQRLRHERRDRDGRRW